MAPPGCKITAMAMFLYVLTLIHSPADASVTIGGFSGATKCTGVTTTCLNIAVRVCCLMNPGVHSVRFDGLGDRNWGNIYNVDFCNNPVLFSRRGPKPFCVGYEGKILSARFIEDWPPTKAGLVEADDVQGCNSTMLPNAVVYYTSDEAWVLQHDSDKMKAVLKHVESLPDDQKLAWMKNAGAELHPSMGKMDVYDADLGTE